MLSLWKFLLPYRAKLWQGKTLANQSFQSFSKENFDKFTIAHISYFESGIGQGKILANDICFAKFAKASPTRILHYAVTRKGPSEHTDFYTTEYMIMLQ